MSLMSTLGHNKQPARCLQLGREELARPEGGPRYWIAIVLASCALKLDAKDPARAPALEQGIAHARKVLADADAPLSEFDRINIAGEIADLLTDAGRKEEARKQAQEAVAMIERAQASAPDPQFSFAYDEPLARQLLLLDQADRAQALLEKREALFPDEYAPSLALAWAMSEAKRYPAAEAAVERALVRVGDTYARARVLRQKAHIAEDQKKPAQAIWREVLAALESVPETMRSERAVMEAKKKLEPPREVTQEPTK
jgi:tetratricopeptide (TPR) repeat protein